MSARRLPRALLRHPSVAHGAQIRWFVASTSKHQNRGYEADHACAYRNPYTAARVHRCIMLGQSALCNLCPLSRSCELIQGVQGALKLIVLAVPK